MNTSIKLKQLTLLILFSTITLTKAFSQSVTILPKSQTNTDTLSTKFFRMSNGAGAYKVMVSDNVGKARWTDTLSTKFFRMTEGAGLFNVMISDSLGNGVWVPPIALTDNYWTRNNTNQLYQTLPVNLGIGTDEPAYKLDVRQNAVNTVASFSSNNWTGTGIRISTGITGSIDGFPVSSEWHIFHSRAGTYSNNGGLGQLHFKDQTSTKMIIRNNGRIGIGVLNPSEMLEVNGNARINGKIDIHNSANSVFIGEEAGKNDDLSNKYNTYIGYFSGKSTVNGGNNVAIGAGAMEKNTSGDYNTAVGRLALVNNTSGTHNTALGGSAGFNSTGSYNVFLGYSAGSNETGNDKLYIQNSSSSTPLIYGDFVQKNLGINGRLIVGAHTPYESSSKLDVIANANVRFIVPDLAPLNNTIIGARLVSATGKAPQMRFAGAGANLIDIGQDVNGSFVVEGNDTSRFVIKSTGEVGIGVTNPVAQLAISSTKDTTIQATSSSVNGTWLRLKNSSLGGRNWNLVSTGEESDDHPGKFLIRDDDENAEFVMDGNTGFTGIGIYDPSCKLEVQGTANDILRIISPSATGTWFTIRNNSSGGKNWKFISTGANNSEGSGNLLIKDDTGSRMFIENTTGAVGFGTTSPAAQMEVLGKGNDILRVSGINTTGTWLSMINSSSNNIWKMVSTGTSSSQGMGHLLFRDNTATRMILKSDGAVGIGTDTPTQAKLVVNGSLSNTLSYGYLNSNGSTGSASGSNTYSIYTSHRIATSEINVYSDARIKKIKRVSNNADDLSTLMNIQITDYQLIDSISKGNTNYKKVIAQQVESVYPSAVTKMTDFIPDIYQLSSIDKGFIPLPKTTLKAGDKLKLITEEKQEVVEVLSVLANGIQVNSDKNGKVFVYGKEVHDFRTVDYEALTTLNISATQQLLKRIEILEKENQDIKQLKQDVESMKNTLLTSQKGK